MWFKSFVASRAVAADVRWLRVPAPSLIWVHGRWSGDMMIDGVPDVRVTEDVRLLNLFGKSTQQGVATGGFLELAAGIS